MATKKAKGATAPAKGNPATRFAVINDWQTAKEHLARAQEIECNARMLVGDFFFKERVASKKEGSETAMVEGVWKLTWKQPYNYTVDEAALEAVKKELADNKIDPDKFFRYKPALVMSEYREADETALLILSQAVEAKPGMPQLEIKHAKKGDASED